MSEYWVSHKRYFCKYCNIYIADDAPSRRQHEGGLKHKGNVERFVRGLYKAGEKRKQDLEEERREMARIEKAANAAYEQDVGAGRAKGSGAPVASSSSSSSTSAAAAQKPPPPPKPSNPYANYSTAESLGFTDPDAERERAEAERRRTEGAVGAWEVVDVPDAPAASSSSADGPGSEEGTGQAGGEVHAGEKRAAEAMAAPAIAEDEESGRAWKLRRKTANVGLGELYDPGALPIKLKAKKAEPEEGAGAGMVRLGEPAPLGGSARPAWSARGWNKPGEYSTDGKAGVGVGDTGEVKAKEGEQPKSEPALEVPPEPETVKEEEVKPEPVEHAAPPPPAGGSMFKKRKAPVGGGSRGGRRI